MKNSRHLWIRLSILLLTASLAQSTFAVDTSRLSLNPYISAPGPLVAMANAGDTRLFLTIKDGRIFILEGGSILSDPFLDIRERVGDSGSEQGLLGTAFHPTDNRYFFVYYTDNSGGVVISRFQVNDGDPFSADPNSERVLLRIPQPFGNHNGGQLQFGRDGYLYIGPGDGGSANDPECNAQDGSNLLGKILRVDVDQNFDQAPYHGIPADNPFLGNAAVRDEIWILGLRNPWRFSFDRLTGDLFVADVGQNQREEVHFQAASSPGGENYGWKMMEGTRCTNNTSGCGFTIPGCNAPDYTPPILEYDHIDGNCAITGGYIARTAHLPDFDGVYFYGDFCSGRLFAAENTGNGWTAEELPARLPGLVTFGEGADGKLYLATREQIFTLDAEETVGCEPGPTTLCLNNGRFRVESQWQTPDGDRGAGQAIDLTDETGYFWFFNQENIEIVVKVLAGCFDPFNHYWVFAAGLTNVEVELTVTDTLNGLTKTYSNPLNTPFEPIQDTRAFDTCP